MALPANSTWEIRTATGAPTNGGGWVPGSSGTDYSQQASPQYSLTNGVANGTTTIATTSASSDMVGNIAYVAGGTGSITGARYQIVSQTTGVSIVVDRSTGLTAGTGVTINVGGALASIVTAVAAATQNNLIWCNGSQTITSTMTLSLSYNGSGGGVNYGCFTFIGYTATRGDGGRFTLTTATNSVNLITYSGGQYMFQNFLMSCTAGTPGYGIIAGTSTWYFDLVLVNCRVTGFEENIRSPYSTQIAIVPLTLINCEIDSAVSHGIETVSQIDIVDSYIHGNGGHGLYMTSASGQVETGFTIIGSVFYNNTNDGIHHLTAPSSQYSGCKALIVNSALVSNGGDGYNFASASAASINLINVIITQNGTGLSSGSAVTVVGTRFNCAFYGNTTKLSNFPTNSTDITLTGDPFTSKSTGDFTLNSTAGAGAACKAAGFQSTLI